MTNTDERAAAFLARLIRLEQEKRENAEDRSELAKEMKGAGLLAEEVAGIKLAVKRHFETQEKRIFRESAESFAETLGEFRDTPLGAAAIKHAKNGQTKPSDKAAPESRIKPGQSLNDAVAEALIEAGVPFKTNVAVS